jgi:hypothetical protein
MPFDPIPPVVKWIWSIVRGYFRRGSISANRDKKNQTAHEESHPADDQRNTHRIHATTSKKAV